MSARQKSTALLREQVQTSTLLFSAVLLYEFSHLAIDSHNIQNLAGIWGCYVERAKLKKEAW